MAWAKQLALSLLVLLATFKNTQGQDDFLRNYRDQLKTMRLAYSDLGLRAAALIKSGQADGLASLVKEWKALEVRRERLVQAIMLQPSLVNTWQTDPKEDVFRSYEPTIGEILKTTGSLSQDESRLTAAERIEDFYPRPLPTQFFLNLIPRYYMPYHASLNDQEASAVVKALFTFVTTLGLGTYEVTSRDGPISSFFAAFFLTRLVRAAQKTYYYSSVVVPRIQAAQSLIKELGILHHPFWDRIHEAGYPTPYSLKRNGTLLNEVSLSTPMIESLAANKLSDEILVLEPFDPAVRTELITLLNEKIKTGSLNAARMQALQSIVQSLQADALPLPEAIDRAESLLKEDLRAQLNLNDASRWMQRVTSGRSLPIVFSNELSRSAHAAAKQNPEFVQALADYENSHGPVKSMQVNVHNDVPAIGNLAGLARVEGNFAHDEERVSFKEEVCHNCKQSDPRTREIAIVETTSTVWTKAAIAALQAACQSKSAAPANP